MALESRRASPARPSIASQRPVSAHTTNMLDTMYKKPSANRSGAMLGNVR